MAWFREYRTCCAGLLLAVACCTATASLRAADDATFTGKVLPILAKHCLDCHGAEEPEASLNLSTRESLLLGARSGYIVTPGKAKASLVTQLLVKGSKPHMPPEGQLTEDEIAVISKWVDELGDIALPDRPLLAKGKDHWAFQPAVKSPLPEVRQPDLAENVIDRFTLVKLEKSDLTLSAPADRATLLRRAAIDLVGLPPSPEEVQSFAADESPDAYERRLDQLLSSPAYGERWGRHWLDLARYADSGGFHDDLDRPHAWRYRDYVIRSLNADAPYADFIRDQLAGDEYAPDNENALAATAFCRNGPTNDDNMGNNAFDREKYRLDLLDDVISTTSAVYLGLTVGCARCHDHKFDPIPQTDYYQLLAVFNNITRKDIPFNEQGRPQLAGKWAKGQPGIMAITDVGRQAKETFVLYRGDLNNKGPKVQADVPQVLRLGENKFQPAATESSTGQRLALANWIASEHNPLSWRVITNRLWQHHFSRGIVSTPSNFGLTGAQPTHRELLDWLAVEMPSRNGSWKAMHRLMMSSATYRQASQGSAAAESIDPENLLLWRMNKRRLEAEAIRDSVLSVAGTLNERVGGPGVKPRIPAELLEASQRNKWPVVKTEGPDHWRRSVYIYVKRQMPFPLLELFDIPSTAHTCDCRQDSTIPTQALVLMNDQFTQDQASWLAKRVQREAGQDPRAASGRALWLALGREPTSSRLSEAEDFLRIQTEFHQAAKKTTVDSALLALTDLCHVLLNSNEFLYVD
ncbi:PSD1 and planctomycete cytochrome C domain-containing protein [Anatilimnocola sp. NA78]|uniref:PSD1 and planctomycete cytochrome C domain-containing protein n=1 Tax=Anatilimnocola sp. NA78 TaxID=3415683 RepID=UPI003CE5702C